MVLCQVIKVGQPLTRGVTVRTSVVNFGLYWKIKLLNG